MVNELFALHRAVTGTILTRQGACSIGAEFIAQTQALPWGWVRCTRCGQVDLVILPPLNVASLSIKLRAMQGVQPKRSQL
jgi:hypothetical protein